MNRVIVIGCLEETLDTLEHYYYLGGKIDALVTLPPNEAEKAGITNWVDLRPFADRHKLPLYHLSKYSMNTRHDFDLIQGLSPGIIFVIGWQRLIPDTVIKLAELGCVGFHGAANFLPWGRGRSPINWSILEGRNRFILHMFFITPGVDDGDILGFEIYDITPEDTCRTLYFKTAMAQASLMHRLLPEIKEGKCPRYPQTGYQYYYPKRTPEDGKIDWNSTAEGICRLVRAVTRPYPGAFTYLSKHRLYIWRAQNFGDNLITSHAEPGEVVFISNDLTEFVVQCGTGAVLVTEFNSPITIKRGDKLGI